MIDSNLAVLVIIVPLFGGIMNIFMGKRLSWLDRTTVMQHLRVLEKARLIISKKEGRCRWNYLDVSPIQRIHERWIQAYAMPTASMLSKLQQDLETL